MTTVPLLVKEARQLYPFLEAAFANGGVLEGDPIHFRLINPEDDVHSFVLPDLAIALPGGTTQEQSYVARHAGGFPILCAVAAHLPMMSGQLVVLSPAAVAP